MSKESYFDYPAWHNGQHCQVRDLTVSIMDLGLIHSDATYDVMAFRNNQGFKVAEHIERFLTSCRHWRIAVPYTAEELVNIVTDVHRRTGWNDSIIWLSVTRGIPDSGNPRDLANCDPEVMCYAKPYQKFNGTNRATVCCSESAVRVPDLAINQLHKNFVWSDLTQAQWEAIDRGFDTAIVFGTDNYLSEGPGFNVAIIKNNTVMAPARNRLPGISMQLVKDTCKQAGIDFTWTDIDRDTVDQCDDMFLTTTVGNIVTVTNLNGRQLELSAVQKKLIALING